MANESQTKPEKRKRSPAQLANQFKPGNQAAKGFGRPRTKPFLEEMNRVFDENPELFPKIVRNIVRQAAKGDQKAIIEIRDMVDGKCVQAISGPEGGAIPVDLTGVGDALSKLISEIKGGDSTDSN